MKYDINNPRPTPPPPPKCREIKQRFDFGAVSIFALLAVALILFLMNGGEI